MSALRNDVSAQMQVLKRDLATAEVTAALEAAGIDSVLLKGPALAEWLYRDGTPRSYRDSDLLVDPLNFERAEVVLADLGFTHPPLADLPGDKPGHSTDWLRGDDVAVDLHHRLWGSTATEDVVWRALRSRTRVLSVGARDVLVPTREVLAMHVALHAAQNGPNNPRSSEDLRRAIAIASTDVWEGATRVAHEIGATAALSAGLRLHPDGGHIADRLGLPRDIPPWIRLQALGLVPEVATLEWLRSLGPRQAARLALRKLFPPLSYMRAWTPLPLRAVGATPLAQRGGLGVVWAYLQRLGWLLLRTPGALLAWQRARRP